MKPFTASFLLLCALVSCLAAKPHPRKPVNINTATAAELQQLPGIGPARAAQIIRLRRKNGSFRKVEELRALPRLSERQFQQLKKYATVGEQAASAASASK
jgi:competence protein ComEA